jgi:hypothetical protein
VALAPDLPAGYFSWGVALAKHGDLPGAIAKLTAANQRGLSLRKLIDDVSPVFDQGL